MNPPFFYAIIMKQQLTHERMSKVQPEDIIWRLLERLGELQNLCQESIDQLHPKKNNDLISSIEECERLCRTQINVMNRIAKRY